MIKRNVIKCTAAVVAIFLFFSTAADTFIKTVGDISKYPVDNETQIQATLSVYEKETDTLRIMTYNLLSDGNGFDGSEAKKRADGICRIIRGLMPDAAGLQEVSRNWYACIVNNTRYRFVAPVRTGISEYMTAIIYNPQTLDLIKSGQITFESGDDSRLRRMVWGLFKRKNDGMFFVILNTHLNLTDSENTERENSVPLSQAKEIVSLCEKLKQEYICPIIVTGDFNAKEQSSENASPVYGIMHSFFEDSKEIANELSQGENKTAFNAYDRIFVSGITDIKRYCILSHKAFSEFSDHYPVFSDIFF